MIAPTSKLRQRTRDPRAARGRRAAAEMLLAEDADPRARPQPVASWKAWLLATWMAMTAAIYLAYMLREFLN